jgi:hypothetical protein
MGQLRGECTHSLPGREGPLPPRAYRLYELRRGASLASLSKCKRTGSNFGELLCTKPRAQGTSTLAQVERHLDLRLLSYRGGEAALQAVVRSTITREVRAALVRQFGGEGLRLNKRTTPMRASREGVSLNSRLMKRSGAAC